MLKIKDMCIFLFLEIVLGFPPLCVAIFPFGIVYSRRFLVPENALKILKFSLPLKYFSVRLYVIRCN